jgi:hypothetical protein
MTHRDTGVVKHKSALLIWIAVMLLFARCDGIKELLGSRL